MRQIIVLLLTLGATTSLALAEPLLTLTPDQMDSIAAGRRDTAVTDQGQGNLNNDNVQNNPGTVTETTTGPPGQIQNERFDCNNCETRTTGPGNSNN